jgi:hypothetical protein
VYGKAFLVMFSSFPGNNNKVPQSRLLIFTQIATSDNVLTHLNAASEGEHAMVREGLKGPERVADLQRSSSIPVFERKH